ncbi:nephrin [Protopterus annectens]|uniref:nephrin n=1 Tax=Protopterus annectens TaxID=7888 RepID=UPI001CFB732C|nr:nephrin [Protopterus annectens]
MIRKVIEQEWDRFIGFTDLDKIPKNKLKIVYKNSYNLKNLLEKECEPEQLNRKKIVKPKETKIKEYTAESVVTWVAGKEYVVTCRAEDTKPASEIIIIKSGIQFSSEKLSQQVGPGSKPKLFTTEATVKVMPQSSDNTHKLVCGALNQAISTPVLASFTMNVLFPPDPPTIRGLDQPTIKAGETVLLVCSSSGGNPLATLQWSKNNEIISTKWDMDDATKSSHSYLSLMISPADNMANLTCEATNLVSPQPLYYTITLRVVFLPTEVTILGSAAVAENKQIYMSCFTGPSNPPVHIRWWLGWKELLTTEVTVSEGANGGTATMSNLTYIAIREDNDLPLTCEAFNEAILYTKIASVTLKVLYPPQKIWLEGPSQGKQFRAGTKVKLTCLASGGNPPASLKWYKENKFVKESTSIVSGKISSREIIITTAPDDNQATYRCNASNDARAAPLTAFTKLHILFPSIDVKITPSAKQVKRGQSVTLTCVIGSSNPLASLIWLKDGNVLKGTEPQAKKAEHGGMSATGKVTIVTSSSDNGKRVTCQSYSAVLTESVNTFYKLNVLYPPEFAVDQVTFVEAVEDGAVLIPLKVSANPPDITYTWSFKGEDLVKEGVKRYHLREMGALEIWNLTRADAGDYKIHCKNTEGENQTVIKLIVHYSPSVKSIGDPTEVDIGGTAEIICVADAVPIKSDMFTWKWLGNDEREFTADQQVVQEATGKLIIRDAKRSDAGRYQCNIDNGIPPPAKGDAKLIVRFKPEIQRGVHLSKVAASGDGRSTATLTCKAEGVPNVEFSWARQGVTIDLNNPRYSEKTVHEGALHTSFLTIVNVSAALDYAVFTCTAKNPLGIDVFDIQLVSTSRPDPPTELIVANFSHNSVTLQWKAGFNGGLEQKFRVRYHWKGATSFMYVDVFPPQATIFTITGLTAQTTYNFSVNSINALGESEYADGGAIITVTTLSRDVEGPPPAVPVPTTAPLPAGLPIPVYVIVILAAAGALLLVSNISFMGCWIHKQRRLADEMKKEDRSKLAEPNQYGDGELINTAAKQTLLIDSASEHSYSTYESSEGLTSSDGGYYYYPGNEFHPTLYPHQETSETMSNETSSIQGRSTRIHWGEPAETHEYEEVGGRSIYEDLGGVYSHSLSSVYPIRDLHHAENYVGAYQRRGRPLAEYEEPVQLYDSVPDYQSTDLPFQMRGELV